MTPTQLTAVSLYAGSLIQLIQQLLNELKVRIEEVIGDSTLPPDTFDTLNYFLISFASAPDLCSLPLKLESQVRTLVEATLSGIFEGDHIYGNLTSDPTALKCLVNVSESLVQPQQRRLTSSFLRLLQDLSLFSESLTRTRQVLQVLRHYTLSDTCVAAITRMTYCPMCAGYGNFKPCQRFCINTLRGCFADLAEVQLHFGRLMAALRVLSKDLIRELAPENFAASYLSPFVSMAEELREREGVLREAVSREREREREKGGGENCRLR